MKKIIIFCVVLSLLATGLVWWLAPSRFPKPSKRQLEEVAGEVVLEGEWNKSPVIDPVDSELAYARTTTGGRALFLMNIKTGAERRFSNRNEIAHPCGYSPDGRFLLFDDVLTYADRIMLSDRSHPPDGPYAEGRMDNISWVSSNSFCFSYRGTNFGQLITLTPSAIQTNRFDTGMSVYGMTPVRPNQVAWIRNSGICLLDVATGHHEDLTLENHEISACWSDTYAPEWFTYSPQNNEFLFCSWDKSDWRHLYRLTKENQGWSFEQETKGGEHSYNGRWIQNGKGFAFIGNRTNHFYLAIRPDEQKGATNLFAGGHVFGYTVSWNGDTIYAIGSIGAEPLGIWEYTISSRTLRYVGGRAKLSQAEPIPREEHWVSSFDGTKVPYYLLTPKNLEKRKKHPAIIFLPIWGMQNFPAWEMFSQFFANIGVFHVAVNHRGIDGYGKAYKEWGVTDADKDVEAVYQDIVKTPNIDTSRIFLMTYSEAAIVANEVIEHYPGQWAGVINIAGVPPPREQVQTQRMRVFLFVGDQDTAEIKSDVMFFESWAAANNVKAHVLHSDKTRHIITSTEVDKKLLLALANFVFEN